MLGELANSSAAISAGYVRLTQAEDQSHSEDMHGSGLDLHHEHDMHALEQWHGTRREEARV
jgi:hypothetical protein